MEKPEVIRAREIADERYWGDLRNDATAKRYYDTAVACIIEALQAARPTADLGDDGELVAKLVERAFERMAATNFADASLVEGAEDRLASARAKVSDRLILYREALERIASAITGDNGLAKILSEQARAVLSRSGKGDG